MHVSQLALLGAIRVVIADISAVRPSESFGNKVLESDVELVAAPNQFGAITIANYKGPCDCKKEKACDEPPDYKHWDSSRDDFFDRTLEEQTTARVGAMMLLSRGCWDPKKDDGPGHMCPLKHTKWLDAIKRAGQENVTKLGLFDDNNDGWAQIRNHNKGLKEGTPFDFSDQSSWKYVFDYNYKVFFELVPRHMWYLVDGKPVIAMWQLTEKHYPKGRSHIGAFMQWLKAEFKKTFAVEPVIVPPKSVFDAGSSAKSTDVYCVHDWFSSRKDVSFSVVENNGFSCGAMCPGYRDKCSVMPCEDCRNVPRKDGARLADGLSANANSKFALMEGWNDVRENAGYYRSKAWSTPSLYINTIRQHADPSPLTLRLQAETADRFYDTTPQNEGGEYRESGLDIGKLAGLNGGWYVGWTQPDEWIEFPHVLLGCGIHRFTARLSSDSDSNRVRLVLPTLSSQTVPMTGSAQYGNVHLGEVMLDGGEHSLRILFETGGVNIDWLFVKKATSCNHSLYTDTLV